MSTLRGVSYFHKGFSPKGDFPSDTFPIGNFPNVQFSIGNLDQVRLGPLRRCRLQLGPSFSNRIGQGPSAVARIDWGAEHYGQDRIGKLPLGKLHIWEVATLIQLFYNIMFKYKGRECIELSRNLFSPTLKCKAGKKTFENFILILTLIIF